MPATNGGRANDATIGEAYQTAPAAATAARRCDAEALALAAGLRTLSAMAVPLSPSLALHQRSSNRVPAFAVTASALRFGIEQPRWIRYYSGTEADSPAAATIANDGSLIRARNDAGTLYTSRVTSPGAGSTYSSWTNLATVTAGNAVALAAKPTELLLAYVDNTGLTVKIRTSADNGITWSAPTTIVTEATAIAGMAAAYRPNGDACLFYCVGANIKSLRRAAGVWAGAGTSWSRASSVATLSGVAAVHDGADFVVALTGTAATTNHPRTWGAWMGDGGLLASNQWSGIVPIAEADSLSSVTFTGPALDLLSLIPHVSYAHKEAANVPFNRAYTAHTDLTGSPTGTWTEPAPHEAQSAFGIARASNNAAAWSVTPSGVWYASRPPNSPLTSRVLSVTFEQTPENTRARVTLDNHDGALNAAPNTAYPSLIPGGSITLSPGYASGAGGAAEYGTSVTLAVQSIRYGRANGRSICTVDAVGPWEILSHWRPPQAWQTAIATLTRSAIFKRIANRAGITVNGSGSANWGADKPAFAIPAAESGAAAAARLFSVESSFLIPGTDFKYANPTAADPAALTYGGAGGHPVATIELTSAPASANWIRLQGPDRYADAHTPAAVYQFGPRLTVVRSMDAATDAKASAYAANALRRHVVLTPQGELTCPLDAAAELFDVLAITDPELGLTARKARIIRLSWRFERRGSATGRARYEATYTLGGL